MNKEKINKQEISGISSQHDHLFGLDVETKHF